MYASAAVVGTGFIGPVHVEALRRLGVPLRGVLGSTPEKSESARLAMGLPKAYVHFDELLADPAVQVVHLALPNVWHFDMAKRALQAGRHVLCEKPLAMNSGESAELVALARTVRRTAAVCYNVRFYPLNVEAGDRVRRGELGSVVAVNGSYVQDWLLYDTDYNWRVLAEHGGELRAVADIGTHWIDLVTTITGLEVEAVFADLRTVHPLRQRPTGEIETFTAQSAPSAETAAVPIATDDYGCILFRFRGGARGSLWVSQVTAGRKNCLRYEIAGSRSALAWDSESPNELWIGHRDRPNERLTRDPRLVGPAARRYISYPGGHNEGFADTFKQCFRAFYDAIAAADHTASPTFPTFDDGHREIVICEAILRSHREQQWVNISWQPPSG
jgi:predicted dehydrogenase